jgi:energy-converting hydrogenase Eha subunit A
MHAVERTEGHPSSEGRGGKTLLGRPWLLTILLASGLCVAYLIGVFVNWGDAADRSLYANLGMIPIGLAATILAASASKTQADRRSQWAWRLLAAGLGCFLAGDVLFFIYQNVIGSTPFPSLADAGYLAYYPLVLAGLLCFPGLPNGRLRRATLYLDCFMVVLGGAIVILYFYLLPTLQSTHDSNFAYSLSIGYPVGDLFLLAGIVWALLRRVSGRRLSIMLLSAGLVVGLVADVVYGYQSVQGTFQSGGFSDAAYMLSWALFAWAGYAEAARNREKTPKEAARDVRRVGTLLPYCFALLGVGLLVYVNRSLLATDQGLVVLAAAGLILLSVVRQVLGTRESRRQGVTRSLDMDGVDED